jgi:hypothetical protein
VLKPNGKSLNILLKWRRITISVTWYGYLYFN